MPRTSNRLVLRALVMVCAAAAGACERAEYGYPTEIGLYCSSVFGSGPTYARQMCDCPVGQTNAGEIDSGSCWMEVGMYRDTCVEYRVSDARENRCTTQFFTMALRDAVTRGVLEYDAYAANYRFRVVASSGACGDEAALFGGGRALTRRFVATKYDVIGGKARIGERCEIIAGESALLTCREGICAIGNDGQTRCLAPAIEGAPCPTHELGCAHPDEPIGFSRLYCDASTSRCQVIKPSGVACRASEECVSGFCSGGLCTNKKADGIACGSAAECASSYCGSRGTCAPKKANGEPCTSPLECAAGACVTGRCRAFACGMGS